MNNTESTSAPEGGAPQGPTNAPEAPQGPTSAPAECTGTTPHGPLHGAARATATRAAVTEAAQISTLLSGLVAWAESPVLDQNEQELAKAEVRAWSNLALRRLAELREKLDVQHGGGSFDCHPPAPPQQPPPAPQAPAGPPTTNYVPGPNAPGGSVPEGGTLPGSPGQTSPGTPGTLAPGEPGQTDPSDAAVRREHGAAAAA